MVTDIIRPYNFALCTLNYELKNFRPFFDEFDYLFFVFNFSGIGVAFNGFFKNFKTFLRHGYVFEIKKLVSIGKAAAGNIVCGGFYIFIQLFSIKRFDFGRFRAAENL